MTGLQLGLAQLRILGSSYLHTWTPDLTEGMGKIRDYCKIGTVDSAEEPSLESLIKGMYMLSHGNGISAK